MSFFSDLLLIALLVKFIWETLLKHQAPWELFAIAVMGMPFLLGVGGRSANKTLREGIAIVGFIIFFAILSTQGVHAFYFAVLCFAIICYLWGRIARRRLTYIAGVLFIIIAIIFFAARI